MSPACKRAHQGNVAGPHEQTMRATAPASAASGLNDQSGANWVVPLLLIIGSFVVVFICAAKIEDAQGQKLKQRSCSSSSNWAIQAHRVRVVGIIGHTH